MERITTFTEFRTRFLDAIGYSLQFGRFPHSLYPRYNQDGNIHLYYPYARIQEVFDMAAKKGSKNRTPFGNVEFINFKFDRETKEKFEQWYASKGNTVIQGIFETIQAEYKLSVSYDSQNECFIASMTGKEDSLNPNKCIVIRSSEWMRALAGVAFVNIVLFDGEIWEASGETDML